MEVDLLDRHAVDGRLGRADGEKRCVGLGAYMFRRVGLLHELSDLVHVAAVGLRRNLEVHLPALQTTALHFADVHADTVEMEPLRQRPEPLRIEPNAKQRSECHVAGDAAEGIEDCNAHVRNAVGQKRYDAPLPVLKSTTSASSGMRFWRTSFSRTPSAQPPSGAASIPDARLSLMVSARMTSSSTAAASPPLSYSARRMSRSPSGPGTRNPLACVSGFSHGVARSACASNARTMGAQPLACATIMRGKATSGGSHPPSRISAKTFHIPMSPVPPPVG